jgi:hypothetical protein
MINFNTNKIIAICYPSGAGGNFLMNCLGLSDDAVFQCQKLANQQLDGNFSQTDKITLLHQRLEETVDQWIDLRMGVKRLSGVDIYSYSFNYPEFITEDIFDPIIHRLTELDKHYFFMAVHTLRSFDEFRSYWKNSKIIAFENSLPFLQQRGYGFDKMWYNSRGVDWPKDPPKSLEEIEAYPANLLEELWKDHYRLIKDYILKFKAYNLHEEKIKEFKQTFTGDLLIWDTNWYLSAEDTVREVGNLYDKLNLSNFNPTAIADYYHAWHNKLQELKINNKKSATNI